MYHFRPHLQETVSGLEKFAEPEMIIGAVMIPPTYKNVQIQIKSFKNKNKEKLILVEMEIELS